MSGQQPYGQGGYGPQGQQPPYGQGQQPQYGQGQQPQYGQGQQPQYGQGQQPGQGQYGPGQYGPGQYGPGQYGPGQYGQGQYGQGQYGRGQYAQGQPPYGSGPSGPGGSPAPGRKSPLLILGIVGAALVLLIAVGGIFIALSGGGNDPGANPTAPITPDTTAPPTTSSVPSSSPSSEPSDSPSTGGGGGGGGSGSAIDLGHDISLTPASGWDVESQKTNLAVLTNSDEIFVGQVAELSKDDDPRQVVDTYHQQLAKNYTDVKYQKATSVSLGSSKLKGAKGAMTGTASGGSGSADVIIFSVASIRSSDGVTVVGTIYFNSSSDTAQVNKDFAAMLNSMLKGQAAG